jgi:lambda repressor-like predicted transcriptional regulator
MTLRTGTQPGRERTLLTQFLTALHWIHGPNWAELSRRTGLSVSTLQRTARRSGPVPREENVIAYIQGITDDPQAVTDAMRLWRRARAEERGRLRTLRAPAAAYVRQRGRPPGRARRRL